MNSKNCDRTQNWCILFVSAWSHSRAFGVRVKSLAKNSVLNSRYPNALVQAAFDIGRGSFLQVYSPSNKINKLRGVLHCVTAKLREMIMHRVVTLITRSFLAISFSQRRKMLHCKISNLMRFSCLKNSFMIFDVFDNLNVYLAGAKVVFVRLKRRNLR